MASLNRVNLIGNLGDAPELKELGNDKYICKFSLATKEKSKDKEVVEWHRIVVFGSQAKACHNYLSKGSLVHVEGKIHSNVYKAKDGTEKRAYDIIANSVLFLSPKSKDVPESIGEFKPLSDDDISNIPF